MKIKIISIIASIVLALWLIGCLGTNEQEVYTTDSEEPPDIINTWIWAIENRDGND